VLVVNEWSAGFKSRTILLLACLVPLLVIALPLLLLADARNFSSGDVDLLQAVLANQFMLLFFLPALLLSVNIAAHSILEEKRNRSLEAVLLTPISLSEMLAGKVLAAMLPGVLCTWLSFLIYLLLARLLVINTAVYHTILSPAWLLAILLVVPGLSLLCACLGLLVSVRAGAVRAVEQLSMLLLLPVLLLFAAQTLGLSVVHPLTMLALALAVGACDLLLLRLIRSLFQRETLLVGGK
jgi:ABC-2 type transport system permease protein